MQAARETCLIILSLVIIQSPFTYINNVVLVSETKIKQYGNLMTHTKCKKEAYNINITFHHSFCLHSATHRCHNYDVLNNVQNRWLAMSVDTQVIHISLLWRHNDHNGLSNHQPHSCLLNRLFRRRSKTTSKFHVTGLVWGIHRPGPVNSLHKGQVTWKMFPFDDVENVSIWWRGKCFHLMTLSCQNHFHICL